jgi:hypothetical protein
MCQINLEYYEDLTDEKIDAVLADLRDKALQEKANNK